MIGELTTNDSNKVFPLLEDVIGQDKAVKKMDELLTGFTNKEIFSYYGVASVKGILLYGPPGTGKTMLVKAFCNESGILHFPVDTGSVGSPYINATSRNILDVHKKLVGILNSREYGFEKYNHAVFYLDEAESLLGKRYNLKGTKEDNKVVNTLCEIMDGPYSDKRVLFVATTNRKDMVDDAFLRAGRFDVQLELRKPDEDGRIEMFVMYADKLRKADNTPNYKRLKYERLGALTKEFTGADIAYIMKESVRQKIYRSLKNNDTITKDLYVTQGGLEKVINEYKEQKNIKDTPTIGF